MTTESFKSRCLFFSFVIDVCTKTLSPQGQSKLLPCTTKRLRSRKECRYDLGKFLTGGREKVEMLLVQKGGISERMNTVLGCYRGPLWDVPLTFIEDRGLGEDCTPCSSFSSAPPLKKGALHPISET